MRYAFQVPPHMLAQAGPTWGHCYGCPTVWTVLRATWRVASMLSFPARGGRPMLPMGLVAPYLLRLTRQRRRHPPFTRSGRSPWRLWIVPHPGRQHGTRIVAAGRRTRKSCFCLGGRTWRTPMHRACDRCIHAWWTCWRFTPCHRAWRCCRCRGRRRCSHMLVLFVRDVGIRLLLLVVAVCPRNLLRRHCVLRQTARSMSFGGEMDIYSQMTLANAPFKYVHMKQSDNDRI